VARRLDRRSPKGHDGIADVLVYVPPDARICVLNDSKYSPELDQVR